MLESASRQTDRIDSDYLGNDTEGDACPSMPMRESLKLYWALWPMVAGLVCARTGIIVGSYGSYINTDEGLYTDGATITSILVLLIFLVVLIARKRQLKKRQVNNLMRVIVALQIVVLMCLSFGSLQDLPLQTKYALHVINEALGIMALSYWLRCARGASTTTTVVFVFASLALSEVIIGICSMLPVGVSDAIAAMLTLAQLPLMRLSRTHTRPYQISSPTQRSDYFGFMKYPPVSVRFLVITGIEIGMMSIIIGLLRGYPDGTAIHFTFGTRFIYMALTIAICLFVIVAILRHRDSLMTVTVWLIMQALACLSLIVYAAFPNMLALGAIFTTTLNAIMVVFSWYAIIAFMSYGWRDPYYYCIGGFTVFLLPRALARMGVSIFHFMSPDDLLVSTLMAGALMFTAQFVFLELLHIKKMQADEEEGKEHHYSDAVITKVMGLDNGPETFSGLRRATMQQSVKNVGRQFLLSEREMEVLTLYALGYTQQRVADELFITQGTVHAHVKRIYAKTGLHSRQAIIDYLKQYAD